MHLANDLNDLYLPGITGEFGQWRYYQIVMRIADIAKNLGTENSPNYRVKTFDEVSEIYSEKGVSKLLQRAFDIKRLNPIKNYLLLQPDKYLNNLTVAIFGGSPDWLPLDVSNSSRNLSLSETEAETLNETFGVVKLTGHETLFVLDGQHRLRGLRAAIQDDSSIGDETISVTLIIHENTDEGRERTRRLFATINRHAKPVSLGENILLDEDDVSAIVTRKLIEEYDVFKDREVIAQNKTANLYKNQFADKFSTVIALYNINEIILDNEEIYNSVYKEVGEEFRHTKVKVRPESKVINSAAEQIFNYWDRFFNLFPNALEFIKGNSQIGLERKNGGRYYMRPIGQEVIAVIYKKLIESESIDQFEKIANIPEKITNKFWHYVMWDPHKSTVMQSKSHIRDYLFYHLGFPLEKKRQNKLETNYQKYAGEEIQLPKSLKLIK